MSSISTARPLAPKTTFAGRNWYYDFREVPLAFGEKSCANAASQLLQRYSKLTKNWDVARNSEWTCRLFMASKLIMAATLHVNSMHFAEARNLRVVIAYLRYYAVLSLLRAICYTLPELSWKQGGLIQISHTRAIAEVITHLRKLDSRIATSTEIEIRKLKAERELISYRAPSSGDDHVSVKKCFLSLCTLLAEVAQFNSELFEFSLMKHGNPTNFQLLPEYLEKIFSIEIDGHHFRDKADAYQLGYLVRKYSRPANLRHLMTEGHVEDFFGAWACQEDKDDAFNPDDVNTIIFDIP